MEKLMKIITTYIINYKTFLFKPKKVFSKKYNIEKTFIAISLELVKKDNFKIFDIDTIIRNNKDIELLYRLKQEYQKFQTVNLEYYPKNKFQKNLLNLLMIPMSEGTFKMEFLKFMGKNLKRLILRKNSKNFELYLSKEMNYLSLNILPLEETMKFLGELYTLLTKDPEKFFVYFKHLNEPKYSYKDIESLHFALEKSIYKYLYEYEELEIQSKKSLDLQKEIASRMVSKKTLRKNFNDDSLSIFLEDSFDMLNYQAFTRKLKKGIK